MFGYVIANLEGLTQAQKDRAASRSPVSACSMAESSAMHCSIAAHWRGQRELLRNILYSGVWLRYEAAMKKRKIGRSAE